MFFTRKRQRARLLATPLSAETDAVARAKVPLYRRLPDALRPPLQGAVQVLLNEKHWEGCDGLVVTPEMRLVIAAQAALLQLRPEADHFPGLDTILVYPQTFVVAHPRQDEHGFVTEGEDELAGESWQRGVVILSWDDVLTDTRKIGDGYNVVLHEFAHQLDDEYGGGADGAPRLPRALAAPWAAAFAAAYEQHQKRLARRREVLFDDDAAEDPAEFFATAVELFFELPRDMKKEFAEVYAVLAEYLGVDPSAWTRAAG
jgi:Mlc titration factor MtfA (ptsG expression regulator)